MKAKAVIKALCLLFLLTALVSPSSAVQEISREGISNFNINAPTGYSLSQMEIYDLQPNSNNTFIFDAYGQAYTLTVNSTKSWGWWDFYISLQYPNGTISTTHLNSLAPAATDWDLHVQYYFVNLDSYFDLDVYAALMPLSATLQTNNPTTSGILQFSSISGSSTDTFDLKLYATTTEEFQDQAENAIGLQLSEAANEVFSWTWSAVLSFVGLIPYVGDDLVTAILFASYIIDEVFFYFNLFFVEYTETTILTLEFFIMTYSITRTKTKSPVKLVKNVIEDHTKVVTAIVSAVLVAINLVTTIISAVSNAVQGLKPT